MAQAYFINATTFQMSVNLNAAAKNHILQPFQISTSGGADLFECNSWPAKIEAYAGRNVFGGSEQINAVTVFLASHTAPLVFNVMSDVSIALDLFFYIQDGAITGADMTGDSSGITIDPWTQDLTDAMRVQSLGAISVKQWHE